MKGEMISVGAAKILIVETIKQVSAVSEQVSVAADKRQDAHEDRSRDQMTQMAKAIDKMADVVAESSKENAATQRETNKQLAAGHAQFLKMEERHFNQAEKHDDLKDRHNKLSGTVDELKEEQIIDTLTRKVTWKIGVIVLTGVLGGAFTFAWWMAKTITGAVIQAAKTGVTP